ncbi:MAG TPA: hypothetical protein VNU19_08965 [Candidatus Acidoferrum sp.]|jgi:photosystem II stability/assembly factor-like uncharacterized protein|nr:hypothetical protein [Candidatus Acidoferrum sp.]
MEPDDEPQSHSSTSRLRRAVTLGALSVLVVSLAGLSYLHPGWTIGPAGAQANTSNVAGSRHLAAVDFVAPSIGWVVVDGQSQGFAVLHTSDAGQTWILQLTAANETTSEYLHFFDALNGVVAVLGTRGAVYRTRNGGKTWARQPMTSNGAEVLSADFVDADHGWLLTQASTEGEVLMRTGDGGRTWVGLGNPVAYSDWAYRVLFSDRTHGWLYSQSAAPYAYQSQNAGATWQRVALPGPPGGWPSSGGAGVSVEARPTEGAGVSVTVVVGQSLAQPLPTDSNPRFAARPANQFQLSSVDGGRSWKAISTPASQGAIAYFDALNWLWIGSGVQAKSSDAGSTWSPIRSLLVPAPLPESVQVIDSTHIWFGAMAGPRPLVEGTDDGGVSWSMFLLPPTAG